jgi:molecular chaperone GrpE (heat shock protein)
VGGEVLLGEVVERLGRVEEHIAEFHRRSAHRESVIDRLHEDNQRLRGGIGRAVLEPVIADLVRLYDQLDREARRLGEDGLLLRSFADDVVLILDRCGLEVFSAEPGDLFEHDRHRPLAVVPCDDEARHNTVAEVVAVGFVERDTGRVRRPVQARFHRYTPCPDEMSPDEAGQAAAGSDERDESEAS